jgi:hypothetical protein
MERSLEIKTLWCTELQFYTLMTTYILSYGLEVRTITENNGSRIDAPDTHFLRQVAGGTLRDSKSCEDTREELQTEFRTTEIEGREMFEHPKNQIDQRRY